MNRVTTRQSFVLFFRRDNDPDPLRWRCFLLLLLLLLLLFDDALIIVIIVIIAISGVGRSFVVDAFSKLIW